MLHKVRQRLPAFLPRSQQLHALLNHRPCWGPSSSTSAITLLLFNIRKGLRCRL